MSKSNLWSLQSRSDRDRSEGLLVDKKILARPPVELKSAPVSPAVRPKKEDKEKVPSLSK